MDNEVDRMQSPNLLKEYVLAQTAKVMDYYFTYLPQRTWWEVLIIGWTHLGPQAAILTQAI